ncbi:MAG: phosphoribosylformylglycinamidine synthase subunit PurL [Fimbriimonadaceae bacterium]|nr:phosphoribosylformylglycinamidine synthase subunit PurL [Fimbriimonadaceae bacterium]
MPAISSEVYSSMGLNDYEYGLILDLLKREPSYTELGMFAVMWSEHCGYKYSRPVLAYFKKYKEAMEGSGLENAGVVDIGDGLGITMKVESHNHPSAVEPYQGAATGVGGIIRDILTMGARPIASLNSLRFGPIRDGEGDPEVVKRNRYLFEHVVAGIAGYGNCVGVPTVGGEVGFHARYNGNPLVNAMCVGLLDLSKVTTAAASGVGNPVIYLGSATGKDGIHGASFASEALGEDSDAKRPNVQIGDPFAEKLLIEATLEALDTGAVVAIQDMGAAGLTCSTVEMSSQGKVGMTVDLDKVPMRESDMSGYELMLSESQERMLCVAQKGREQEVLDVFRKWGVHAEIIGEVTNDDQTTVTRHNEVVANLDPTLLTDHCPTYKPDAEEPEYYGKAKQFDPDSVNHPEPVTALKKLLASPNIASKVWVYRQYDQQVQTQSVVLPGAGDAAVLAPRGTKKGISVKLDGNGRWVYFDPYVGGQLAVAEAARNVACTGAMPKAVTDGLNYGNPQKPHVYWQFRESVRGIADAAEAMDTPVISGNVSFYNESDLGEVLPTPLIGMLGVIDDAEKRVSMVPSRTAGEVALIWTRLDEVRHEGLGASEYLAECCGLEDGLPVAPNMAAERKLCEFLVDSANKGLLDFAHDCSDGGFGVALAEIAIVGKTGVSVDVAKSFAFAYTGRIQSKLFGEAPGRVVVGVQEANRHELATLAEAYGLGCDVIGAYGADLKRYSIQDGGDAALSSNVEELAEIYYGSIGRVMAEA